MTTKDYIQLDPWEVWPDGIIPADGSRPEVRLRTPEEGKAWLKEMADLRRKYGIVSGVSAVADVREERDDH
ncbi:MAG: hypothetical protein LIQ30_13285 [Planctomycetes bacterium]|nr:hypothetical protein [Planctomycetota bacterium]MCD7895834.1 hypothetical protein [Planctomycetaceae bacterium]